MNVRSILPFATLSLAASLAAQGPEKHSRGPLVAVPHGLSVDPRTTGTAGDESKVLVKRIGYYDDAMPGGKPGEFPPPPMPGPPDYSTSAILQGIASPPDIDAFSIGADWILSNGDGVMSVPPGHWGGLTFSADRTSQGEAGSVIRDEYGDPYRAGGDLFFYVLPESTVLPPEILDRTYLVQDATEMDIVPPGFTSPPANPAVVDYPEIDAHDLYVSLIYAENPSLAALLPVEVTMPPKAFFSVTDATKHLVPSAWWGGTTPSGATVFRCDWTGTSWTTPVPFLAYDALGLAFDEELDAVAVDLVRDEVLFSTTTSTRDEILWLGIGADGTPTPKTYRMPVTAEPISRKAKLLRTDKVDGICALDPGVDDALRKALGGPELLLPWFPPEAWASVFRSESVTATNYVTTLVGWPPPGRQPGQAVLLVTFPGLSPWIPLHNQARDLVLPFGGSPVEYVLPVPTNHLLIGFDLAFQWLLVDQFTAAIEVPYAMRIQL